MHKILILSLLLFVAPSVASGQLPSIEMRKDFYTHIIRAQGWKCDKVESASRGKDDGYPTLGYTVEIRCKNRKAYYLTDLRLKTGERSLSICHKGVCRELK